MVSAASSADASRSSCSLASSSVAAISSCPNRRAQSAAVLPSLLFCAGSAPHPRSCPISTCRPFPAAAMSAVAPVAACATPTSARLPGARASRADATNGVHQRVERLVRALEKGVHDGRLHGLALGAVRVRGGGVSNGSGAEASAAAEPDGGEDILEVVIRHGVRVSGHANHGTPAEIVAEETLAHGGGHEHQPEVRVPGHGGAEHDGEKIGEEIPLVQLVDDDVGQTGEHRVRPGARQPTQQNAVGAKQQDVSGPALFSRRIWYPTVPCPMCSPRSVATRSDTVTAEMRLGCVHMMAAPRPLAHASSIRY